MMKYLFILLPFLSFGQDSLFDNTPLSIYNDGRTIEVGTRFVVNKPGTVKAIRIFKPSAGVISVSLWKGNSRLFAVPYTGDAGWNRVLVNHDIDSGQYTASYYSTDMNYGVKGNVFTSPVAKGSVTGLSGRYTYNSSSYPSVNYQNSWYGVDVVFSPTNTKWSGFDTAMRYPGNVTVPFPPGTRSIIDSFGTVQISGNTISANGPAWVVIAVENASGELIGIANISFDRPSRNRRPVSIFYDDGTHEPINAQIMILLRDFGMW